MTLKHVFDYIDEVEELPRHLVMLYEEPEYARIVALRFLKNGLEKEEVVSYIIPEGETVLNDLGPGRSFFEKEMQDEGLDTSYYKDKGLLYFISHNEYKITDPDTFKQGLAAYYTMLLKQFGYESKIPPIRGIGRTAIDITSSQGQISQLHIENYIQNDATAKTHFNRGTWICTYKVDDIVSTIQNNEWMKKIIQMHDAVIYLPRTSNGLALNLR